MDKSILAKIWKFTWIALLASVIFVVAAILLALGICWVLDWRSGEGMRLFSATLGTSLVLFSLPGTITAICMAYEEKKPVAEVKSAKGRKS